LMSASERSHLEVVRVLAQRGADVNAARTTDGWTALMWASHKGHLAVAQSLLEHGSSKTAVSTSGRNAHSYAVGNDISALRALLKP